MSMMANRAAKKDAGTQVIEGNIKYANKSQAESSSSAAYAALTEATFERKKSERGETVQRNILIMEENTARMDLVQRWREDAPPDPLFVDETLLLIRLEWVKRSRVMQEERFSHDELKAAWQWVQEGNTFLAFQTNRLEEEQLYARTMIGKEEEGSNKLSH